MTTSDQVMPYHGDAPTEIREIADRIMQARAALAELNDFVFNARSQLAGSWSGEAAEAADSEFGTLLAVTAQAVERLDDARSALLRCSRDVEDTRLVIDALRAQWEIYQRFVVGLAAQMEFATDASMFNKVRGQDNATQWGIIVALLTDSARYEGMQHGLIGDWEFQVALADTASDGCRSLINATLGAFGYVGGGLVRGDLATALGLDGLHLDDVLLGTAAGTDLSWRGEPGGDPWGRLSLAAQAFLVGTSKEFLLTGVSPSSVSRAWLQLNQVQQRALITGRPDFVGATDGVPAQARDEANRLALSAAEASLLAELDSLPTTAPTPIQQSSMGTPWSVTAGYQAYQDPRLEVIAERRGAVDAMLRNLALIASQVPPDTMPPRYLLGFQLSGRGQAIVSVGDPDTAANVATYVPGLGSDAGSLEGDMVRAVAMQASAAAPGVADSAVIAWIGYESPPSAGPAAFDSYADVGAPRLDSFLNGLRASHLGAPSLNTVFAHSYAGLIVAAAATNGGLLPVDQLVLVASAGTELESASQLALTGVPADQVGDRVFVIVSPNDIINVTGWAHSGLPSDPEFGATLIPGDLTGFAAPDVIGYFGVAPSLVPDPFETHSSYWDPGSGTLQAMGLIIAGRYPPT